MTVPVLTAGSVDKCVDGEKIPGCNANLPLTAQRFRKSRAPVRRMALPIPVATLAITYLSESGFALSFPPPPPRAELSS